MTDCNNVWYLHQYWPMKSCACTAKVYLSIPDIPSVSCIVCLAAFQSCTIGGKADFDTWDDWIWEHIPWTTCGLDPSPLRYHNNMTKITYAICLWTYLQLIQTKEKILHACTKHAGFEIYE